MSTGNPIGSLVIVACLLLNQGRSPRFYFTSAGFLLFSAASRLIPAETLDHTCPHTPHSQAGQHRSGWWSHPDLMCRPYMAWAPPLPATGSTSHWASALPFRELWASLQYAQNPGEYICMRDGQRRTTQQEAKEWLKGRSQRAKPGGLSGGGHRNPGKGVFQGGREWRGVVPRTYR